MKKALSLYIFSLQVAAPLDNSVSCEMCEFAISVIDERLDDEATIDQVLQTELWEIPLISI